MGLGKGKHLKSALCGIQNDGTCWLTLYTTTVLVILSVDVSVVVLYVSTKLYYFWEREHNYSAGVETSLSVLVTVRPFSVTQIVFMSLRVALASMMEVAVAVIGDMLE
jgi:hypothetical protein